MNNNRQNRPFRNNNNNRDDNYEKLIKILSGGNLRDISIENQKKIFKFKGYLDNFAKELNMKSNQVRKIFNEIKKIQMKFKNEKNTENLKKSLVLLYPKLKYNESRKLLKPNFTNFIKVLLDKVIESNDIEKDFQMFINIIEGFVGFVKQD